MTQSAEHQAAQGGDVALLRYHWGDAYKITGSERGFRADRLDGLGTLEASTGRGLRDLIVADYLKNPVPRGAALAPGAPASAGSGPQAASAEERLGRVDALDLEPITYKLVHPDPETDAMPLARADRDVALYRCFWKLCVLEPRATLVSARELDHVWHTHMLDTAKYRADCDWVFGFFLDHFPYFGFRGAEDRIAWLGAFTQTRRLFSEHFGIEVSEQPAASACSAHGDVSDCCIGLHPAIGWPDPAAPRPRLPVQQISAGQRVTAERCAAVSGQTSAAAEAMATLGGVMTDLTQITQRLPAQPGQAERVAQVLDRLALEIAEAAAMIRAADGAPTP